MRKTLGEIIHTVRNGFWTRECKPNTILRISLTSINPVYSLSKSTVGKASIN